MTALRRFKPYVVGAIGMAAMALIVSPEVRSAAAALVNVTNTFANPVPTRQSDNPAFLAWGTRVFPGGGSVATIPVPADKYLVIVDVSGFAYSTKVDDVSVDLTSHGAINERRFAFQLPALVGGVAHASGATFLVADPGSTVYVTVNSTIPNDPGGMNVDLHGYYVNAN